jgi:hypothetical protein
MAIEPERLGLDAQLMMKQVPQLSQPFGFLSAFLSGQLGRRAEAHNQRHGGRSASKPVLVTTTVE